MAALDGDYALDPLSRRVYQRIHMDDESKVTRWRSMQKPHTWVWSGCSGRCGAKCVEIIARLVPAKGAV